jgi:hypothetical protein
MLGWVTKLLTLFEQELEGLLILIKVLLSNKTMSMGGAYGTYHHGYKAV